MTKVKRELESPNLDENQDLDSFLEKLNIEKKLYHEALAVSERGKTVILKRTLKDRNVNNYNPMYIKAWNGNMDLQFCHDTYAGKISLVLHLILKVFMFNITYLNIFFFFSPLIHY